MDRARPKIRASFNKAGADIYQATPIKVDRIEIRDGHTPREILLSLGDERGSISILMMTDQALDFARALEDRANSR